MEYWNIMELQKWIEKKIPLHLPRYPAHNKCNFFQLKPLLYYRGKKFYSNFNKDLLRVAILRWAFKPGHFDIFWDVDYIWGGKLITIW